MMMMMIALLTRVCDFGMTPLSAVTGISGALTKKVIPVEFILTGSTMPNISRAPLGNYTAVPKKEYYEHEEHGFFCYPFQIKSGARVWIIGHTPYDPQVSWLVEFRHKFRGTHSLAQCSTIDHTPIIRHPCV